MRTTCSREDVQHQYRKKLGQQRGGPREKGWRTLNSCYRRRSRKRVSLGRDLWHTHPRQGSAGTGRETHVVVIAVLCHDGQCGKKMVVLEQPLLVANPERSE